MTKLLEQINTDKIEMTLGDVVTFHRGYDLPLTEIKKGIYPVVFSNGRKEYHNEFKVKAPGVFTGRSGSLGGMFYVEENYWPHNTTLYVSDFHNNDPKYCYYFLSSFDFSKYNSGTGVPTLNRNHIHGIPVKISSLPTQKKIAEILSAYDTKIENNKKIIKNLEATAQAIFNEWFVNFKFPGHEKVKVVESEMGEIPEGWEIKSLDDVCDISIGRTPPRQEHEWFSKNPKDVNWISIKDLGVGGIFISKTDEYLTKEAVERFNIPMIPKNTLVVSFKLTMGKVAITTEDMLSNEAIAHLKIRKNVSMFMEYLYLIMKNYNYDSLGSTSSIATAVNSKTIKNIKIICPEKHILSEFIKKIKPLFEMMNVMQNESINLKESRDQLLAKLI